ncbi:MAG: hypothetical protein R3E89_09480 [Thiolinea sp.]
MFTILLAVVLLREPFGWFHLAGMLLVMYGGGVVAEVGECCPWVCYLFFINVGRSK